MKNLLNLLADSTNGPEDLNVGLQILIVIGIFAAIALVLALLILLVGKLCRTEKDEKAEQILPFLAGANCGGCGCSGCSAFAAKLAHGEASLSDCHVTDQEGKNAIAGILGVATEEGEPTVMVVHCKGGNNAVDRFEYCGERTCDAQLQVGGKKACSFGCLGEGTCVAVCSHDAIKMENGHSVIDTDLCGSCGACARACPRNLMSRIPVSAPVYVACSSTCRGKDVKNVCSVGCIGCGICAKNCPEGAITMKDNLPVFDYKKCTGCKTCVAKCPQKIIVAR
ncbi:MAG: 4Fe-4S binding protein [Christensenellaceae bacterium]